MIDLAASIRNVPDFPKPGIQFKDITTLLKDAEAFRECLRQLTERYRDRGVRKVVGVESRGFIFGAPLALAIGAGFVPARKPGKLPAATIRQEYALEYGTDALELHRDAIAPGEKTLIVDDLLATGGTLAATARLVETLGGRIEELVTLIELVGLHGRARIEAWPYHTLLQIEVNE